ncbi:hypothetical protein [Paucilactobacillus sp. N302-9]
MKNVIAVSATEYNHNWPVYSKEPDVYTCIYVNDSGIEVTKVLATYKEYVEALRLFNSYGSEKRESKSLWQTIKELVK